MAGTLSGGIGFAWPVIAASIPVLTSVFWLSTQIRYSRYGYQHPPGNPGGKVRDFPGRLYMLDYDLLHPIMWTLSPVFFLLPLLAVWVSFGAIWIVIPFMALCAYMAIASAVSFQ